MFSLTLLIFSACASEPISQLVRTPSQAVTSVMKNRDEIMGANRAKASVKLKAGRDYQLRNVASAFPDNGKNMLIKDRALPKAAVKGARDHSPYRAKIYGNPEHTNLDQARFSILNKDYYATPLSEREATAQCQSPKKKVEQETFYQSQSVGIDDGYEPNQVFETAFDLSDSEDQWLGHATEGIQWDEDWYKIWVSPQYRQVILDLRYQNYLGDIDVRLYNDKKVPVAVSQGTVDDEYLNVVLEKGGYYWVQIYGSNRGNHYDFKYQTKFTGGGDDEYEDNDTIKSAYPLAQYENTWLSKIKGEGVAADNDFYSIKVSGKNLRVVVDLRVEVDKVLAEQGDVDVKLLNGEGHVIASSSNILDDDYIDFTVAAAGTYYLKVYPFNASGRFNMYDLKWGAHALGSKISMSQKRPPKLSAKSEKANLAASR